jgi:hypothetical protein
VRAWFIAIAASQRGEGPCEYTDIFIEDGDQYFALMEGST